MPAWILPSSVTSGRFLNLSVSQCLSSEEADVGTNVLAAGPVLEQPFGKYIYRWENEAWGVGGPDV